VADTDRGIRLTASSLGDTHAIAAALTVGASKGDVLLLQGEMGAGKTAFVQGYAAALGIDEPVTSPTFTLVHTYDTGRLVIHHADLYRLDRHGEIEDLALGELLDTGALLVEWGEAAATEFPERMLVELAPIAGDDSARSVVLRPAGWRWAERWPRLVEALIPWRGAAC
jgi:tRNA threonylcarbamoyladenosine biosynthesis protein TsaE